jgi:lysophospholipase L1-like esterase
MARDYLNQCLHAGTAPVTAPSRLFETLIALLSSQWTEASSSLISVENEEPPLGQRRPSKILVVGLGDSTTAGTPGFLSPLEAPPAGRGDIESQYCYWMMRAHPEWRVLNRGINGQRSDEILSRFGRDVVAARPVVVIILAGVNDIYQRRRMEAIQRNLATMYELAEKEAIVPLAATVLPYNEAGPAESTKIQELNGWIERTANQKSGRLFCDTNLAVRDRADATRLASSPDGLHPDAEGYRRMGDALSRTLEIAGY